MGATDATAATGLAEDDDDAAFAGGLEEDDDDDDVERFTRSCPASWNMT